jgi:alpha-1,2-mannosyltransferase
VVPHASQYYWADLTFLNSSHVARLSNDWNESLLGAISRTVGYEPGSLWLLVVFAVGLAGLALAAQAGRRGDDATGYGLCAVTGLLVSPISWTHHWVMAVPALLLAGLAVWRRRHEAPRQARFWLAVIALVAAIGWTGITRHQPKLTVKQQLHLGVFWLVASEIYVLAGVAALMIGCAAYLRQRSRRRSAAVAVEADPPLAAAAQPQPEPGSGGPLRPRTSE